MRLNRFFAYVLFQILTVPTILMIFRNSTDKKVASLMAASVFLLVTVGTFIYEHKKARFLHKIFWVTGLQFFIFFVLPILLLRIIFWSENFMEISFLGISPATLHGYSNYSFLIWMAGTIAEGVLLVMKSFRRIKKL